MMLPKIVTNKDNVIKIHPLNALFPDLEDIFDTYIKILKTSEFMIINMMLFKLMELGTFIRVLMMEINVKKINRFFKILILSLSSEKYINYQP